MARNLAKGITEKGTESTDSLATLGGSSRGKAGLKRLVNSSKFEIASIIIVMANALFLGMHTNFEATSGGDEAPAAFIVIHFLFAAVLAVEVGMRLAVHGRDFFCAG